jgi:succinate-semialdehyde dehydrogenase/glutarate-semialdehyde dehydrogenase
LKGDGYNIAGNFLPGATMKLQAINPVTDETICEYPTMTEDEVKLILEQSHEAFDHWRTVSFAERGRCLQQAARILRQEIELYARLMTEEMGKPLTQGRVEIEKCAWACDFYAEHAQQFLQPELIKTDAAKSLVTYQPLGLILAIMPWNFPFWQVFRFACPTLMAGNTAVLKHASNVPNCALAIENIFQEAGFPENVFRTLLITSNSVDKVIESTQVQAITLTGSTQAGRVVAAKAGQMLKKTVLELGGSDPYIILQDADLASAIEICVASRLNNSGQSCIAAKRFIVTEKNREAFETQFVYQMQQQKMGDPLQVTTALGPLARADLRTILHQQVMQSIAQGAVCLLGGEIPEGKGVFYPPTVLTNVKPGMPAYDEELFGPVAAIIIAQDDQDALRIANDTVYGLGAALFTQDLARAEEIAANQLAAGSCFVNAMVKSDPRLPFGGIKRSGYGRELSYFGIKEFVNIKTVYIQ